MRPKFNIILLSILFYVCSAYGQSIDIFTGGRAHWWDINDTYDMAVKASPSTTETWSAMWPISSGEPNSVLMTPGDQTNAQWVWATVDANIVDINDSDANDVSIGLPLRTPWRVMYADANSFPLCEDPNLTFYRPEAALGVGLYHINVADVNANNYLQVYTLFDCEPNLLNVTIGRGSDDTTYGPNNTTIGHGAGDSMLNSYRNTLGGKDSGTSLTGGTDNSFWGYQAGKNVTQSGTIRDEAYVVANNVEVVWFDKDWTVLSYEHIGVGTSNGTGGVTCTSEGLCIAGYGTSGSEGPCMTIWDTDLNADEDFFLPDGGWNTSQVMSAGQLSSDESYLYVQSRSAPVGIYKFDMSDGSEVWHFNLSGIHGFDLDSDDNLYVLESSGSELHIYDEDGNELDNYPSFMGWVGCRGFVYDEEDERIYACGYVITGTYPTVYSQVKARNIDGTNYDTYSFDGSSSDNSGTGIIKIGEYIYVTGERTQGGVGGAWANVYKFDEELNLVDSADTGATDDMNTRGLFLDHDGNLAIITGSYDSGETQAGVWILDTDLDYISDHQYATDASGTLSGTKIPYADVNEGSKNTAIGSQALYGATDAEPNEATAGGYKSMYSIASGNLSTGYGAYSLYSLTSGSQIVALGPYAGYYLTTEDDVFVVDDRERDDADDEIVSSILYGHMADDANDQWLNINVGELNLDFARLDVNDVNISGDLVLNTFSEGSVLFTDVNGTVSEDNSNFEYDDSNDELIVANIKFNSKIHIDPCDAPSIVGTLSDDNFGQVGYLWVQDDYVYITAYEDDTISIVDVTDKTNPVLISQLTSTDDALINGPEDIRVIGRYAYVCCLASNTFMVIDVNDPNSPSVIATLTDNTNLNGILDMDISGRYAFVTAQSNNSISSISITDPTNPTLIDTLQDNTDLDRATVLDLRGKFAFVSVRDTDNITAVDISDPTNMSVASTVDTGMNEIVVVRVQGRYVYATSKDSDGIVIVDANDPYYMTVAGTLVDAVNLTWPLLIEPFGDNIAYVTDYAADSLYTIDISDKTSPSIITTATLTDNTDLNGPDHIQIVGNYAYVACNAGSALAIVQLPGINTTSLTAVNTHTKDLSVADTIHVGRNVTIGDGLTVGQRGILSQGYIYANSGISAAGSDTEIQYNDSGFLGANSDFTINKTTSAIDVNAITVTGTANHNYGIDLSGGTWTYGVMNWDSDPNIYANGTELFHSNSTQASLFLGIDTRHGDIGNRNTFIGYQAGYNVEYGGGGTSNGDDCTYIGSYSGYGDSGSNNTGSENVAVGSYTLQSNTSGYENTAIGDEVLRANTTGHGNIGMGNDALEFNTTGNFNTALGTDTLRANLTGGYNVAVGYQSTSLSESGDYNVGIGYQALRNLDGLSNIVAIGYQSLYNVVTGETGNIGIGYQSGYHVNQSAGVEGEDNIYIGDSAGKGTGATNVGAYNIGIGKSALTAIQSGNSNIALGNSAGIALTTGSNNFLAGQDAGYSLTTGSNNFFSGYQAGYNQTTSSNDFLMGYQAGYNANGDATVGDNFIVGYQSFYNDNGRYNLGVGYQAGYNNSTAGGGAEGLKNVFIGYQAGKGDAGGYTGYNNTCIGYQAGTSLSSGIGNTFIGVEAGEDCTIGQQNFGLGASACGNIIDGNYNIGIGSASLATSESGDGNVAIGHASLYASTSHYNIGIGRLSGYRITSGQGNTCIGYFAGQYDTTGSHNTFIGYQSAASGASNVQTQNSAIGAYSLYELTTGDENVTLGSYTGYNTTTGSDNTFVGNQAGYLNTTGEGNVFIGYQVGKAAGGVLTAAGDSDLLQIGNADPSATLPLIEGYFADHASGPHLIVNGDLQVGNTTTQRTVSTPPGSVTLGVGAATFAIESNVMTITGDGGGNTVATITGANSGTLLTLIFVDGNVQITDDDTHGADSVDLSAAFTSADDTTLQLVYDGTSWYETSRSTN